MLLGSLGGFFSKPWKAKKTRQIEGPSITADDQLKTKVSHIEQRDKLGLTSKSNPRQYAEATSAMQKVEVLCYIDERNQIRNFLETS